MEGLKWGLLGFVLGGLSFAMLQAVLAEDK